MKKNQKGLGAGLGALFGEAAAAASATVEEGKKNDFELLPLIRIEPHPEQPRTRFEQERIDELSQSIREHGVITPLLVRKIDSGDYQIIAGERRWRAARAAGLSELPVRIIEADDRTTMELALVENLQREDLSPIEEARGYKSLAEDFGMTQEEIALRVSKSRSSVANSLRLLSLPDELIDMVEQGKLSAGSARALLAVKNVDKIKNMANQAIEAELSVREVEELVKETASEAQKSAAPGSVKAKSDFEAKPKVQKSDDNVDYTKEAQERLTKALGRRVIIKPEKDGGSIEIDYYNADDFDSLFDLLESLHPTIVKEQGDA